MIEWPVELIGTGTEAAPALKVRAVRADGSRVTAYLAPCGCSYTGDQVEVRCSTHRALLHIAADAVTVHVIPVAELEAAVMKGDGLMVSVRVWDKAGVTIGVMIAPTRVLAEDYVAGLLGKLTPGDLGGVLFTDGAPA